MSFRVKAGNEREIWTALDGCGRLKKSNWCLLETTNQPRNQPRKI